MNPGKKPNVIYYIQFYDIQRKTIIFSFKFNLNKKKLRIETNNIRIILIKSRIGDYGALV